MVTSVDVGEINTLRDMRHVRFESQLAGAANVTLFAGDVRNRAVSALDHRAITARAFVHHSSAGATQAIDVAVIVGRAIPPLALTLRTDHLIRSDIESAAALSVCVVSVYHGPIFP